MNQLIRLDPESVLVGSAVALLIASFTLFELTSLDLALQDRFYDFATKRWIVDGNAPLGRLLFYNGPKFLIFVVAATLLAFVFGPSRWRERLACDRRGLFVAILTLACVPALAGLGKQITNTFCPSEIRRYGGNVPYVTLCESYPANDRPERRGHCFPAGHASGGFALVGLAWIRASRRWRAAAMITGLTLGWWMGGYQMLKGAHYLSHTVTTMLLAVIIALSWRLALRPSSTVCDSA